jgi:membrane protein DedA with SNARE-associated domain
MRALLYLLQLLTPYGTHSYFVMFGILIACGFGLPMPEDVVLITGGMLASRGITDFWLVNAICLAGVLIGDGTIFYIGYHYGARIKSKGIFGKILTDSREKAVTRIFDKYGDKVIFMARFMPGLRTPVFLTTGIFHVRPWRFIVLDGLAALISVPLWIWVGYVFGQNLEELEKKIKQFKFGIYSVLALVIFVFVVYSLIKRRALKKIGVPS